MQNNTFEQLSYQAHEKLYESRPNSWERIEKKDTIDYWRHDRMYKMLVPLFAPHTKWLTVGDGVGTDANWLMTNGMDVVASDIADNILKETYARGYVKAFRKENAEKMTFQDNEFNYVVCKESYHHFPRPYLALYEMLRVASDAVILIEPVDIGIQMPYIIWLKNVLDRFNVNYINKVWKNRSSFEEVGNYVYKVSEREIEKVAMGINLPSIAFKGLNDYYTTNLDLSQPTSNKAILNKVASKIARRDLLCKLGLIPYQTQSCIIFKKRPTEATINALKKDGYKYVELPENPYIK